MQNHIFSCEHTENPMHHSMGCDEMLEAVVAGWVKVFKENTYGNPYCSDESFLWDCIGSVKLVAEPIDGSEINVGTAIDDKCGLYSAGGIDAAMEKALSRLKNTKYSSLSYLIEHEDILKSAIFSHVLYLNGLCHLISATLYRIVLWQSLPPSSSEQLDKVFDVCLKEGSVLSSLNRSFAIFEKYPLISNRLDFLLDEANCTAKKLIKQKGSDIFIVETIQ